MRTIPRRLRNRAWADEPELRRKSTRRLENDAIGIAFQVRRQSRRLEAVFQFQRHSWA